MMMNNNADYAGTAVATLASACDLLRTKLVFETLLVQDATFEILMNEWSELGDYLITIANHPMRERCQRPPKDIILPTESESPPSRLL